VLAFHLAVGVEGGRFHGHWFPNAARPLPPLGFRHRPGFILGWWDTWIPPALGFYVVVGVKDGWFHGHWFHIKHPVTGFASSADHRDEDHKRVGDGASATTI
jgi:hypothetical protein